MGDSLSTGESFFGKLKALGNSIESVAVNVGGTVASAGTKVVEVVKDIPSAITFNSDFEHVKSINEFRRQQPVLREHHYTAQEWEEAESRADVVLDKLYPGYFQQDFDPVKYELEQLSEGAGQEEIDSIVERLTTGVEKATGKLSRRVFTKRDQLLHGMSTVASVGDDLKAAFMIARTSRASLKQSGEEIMRNVRVAGQTRRKQYYLELMQVCMNIKRARELQQKLKRAQEMGEYGEAILLCVESFQGVEMLKDLKVSEELRARAQRSYVDTLQRLDGALTAICAEFDPTRYSKVLEGYMLQGIHGQNLAEKVLQCFKEAIMDTTMKVVRSLMMTKPNMMDQLAGGASLDGTYVQLCQSLPVDLLRPCLIRQMEVIYDILASYFVMAQWHKDCLKQQKDLTPAEAGPEGEESSPQQTITAFLAPVCEVLSSSRREVFDLGAMRIKELLAMPGLFKGEDFLQVVEWGQKFLGVGEAFLGEDIVDVRATLNDNTTRFFASYHHENMESLTMLLQKECWKNAAGPRQVSINLSKAIMESPLYTPKYSEEGAVQSFEDWVMRGNPFARGSGAISSAQVHWKQAMVDVLSRSSVDVNTLHLVETETVCKDFSDFSMAAGAEEGATGTLRTPSSWTGGSTSDATRRLGASSTPVGETSGRAPARGAGCGAEDAGEAMCADGKMVTVSSGQALKYFKAYGQLIRALPSRSVSIFHAMCEVFESYLLSCFILFSGITLETLVFQDDIIPTRLKSNILRILSQPNSKYRYAVEELMRMKPEHDSRPPASSIPPPTASFLDRFASKMESIATDVERSMTHMQQKLNDKVQHIQMPAAITSIAGEVAAAVQRVEALGGGAVAQGKLHGLHERIVAAESLLLMAQELQAGRAELLAQLPPGEPRRDAEHYFSPRGTLEAAQDLKDTLFRGAARKLLQGMLDAERGTAQQIASTNYYLRDPILVHSPWAEDAVRCYGQFRDLLAPSRLPASALHQVWDHAILAGSEVMVDGLFRIKRCTFEGRASMSYDLGHVERSVRTLAPTGVSTNFRSADGYVKAFYLPWGELVKWCQVNLAVYGKFRIIALVDVVSDAYGIKKSQKAELMQNIEIFSREFTQ